MNISIKKRTIKFAAVFLCVLLLLGFSVRFFRRDGAPRPSGETTRETARLTFPEGYSVRQIAARLEENGVCSAGEFISAADDPASLEGFSFKIPNPSERIFLLEGYLFPDTYDFYVGENAASVLKKFLRNTESKLTPELRERAEKSGFTVDEILTLASVIQREANGPAEMGKISSVVRNRLASDDFPRLQCDAPSFYLRSDAKPYTDAETYRKFVALYNTYDREGLPAGPINNCGLDAVKAALYPEQTDYYFFFTDKNGKYYYSETWEENLEKRKNAGVY